MKKFFSALLLLLAFASCGFAAEQTTKADLVFFVDASGSMQDYIDSVKNNIIEFSRSLVSDEVDVRFAIVEFKDDVSFDYNEDYGDYYLDKTHNVTVHDFGGSIWTSNASAVEAVFNSIEADGGDETQTDAMHRIFSWNTFRDDAERFGFLLTDEDTVVSSHDHTFEHEHFVTIEELIPKFKNISMSLSVISEMELREHYLNLFSETGGVFIDITQADFYKSMLDVAKWITEQVNIESADRLPYAIIEAVPEDILSDDEILKRIASLASIDVEDINVITPEILDLSLPREPTEKMKRKVNGEFIAKTDTIRLHSTKLADGEQGYYLFMLNIPDEVLSMDLTVSQLKLFYATPDEFNVSGIDSSAMVNTAFDPFTYWEITDLFGFKTDTLAKKVLVLLLGNTGQSLSMWLIKMLLLAFLGGCNSGVLYAGIGVAGLFAVCGVSALRKFFVKH